MKPELYNWQGGDIDSTLKILKLYFRVPNGAHPPSSAANHSHPIHPKLTPKSQQDTTPKIGTPSKEVPKKETAQGDTPTNKGETATHEIPKEETSKKTSTKKEKKIPTTKIPTGDSSTEEDETSTINEKKGSEIDSKRTPMKIGQKMKLNLAQQVKILTRQI